MGNCSIGEVDNISSRASGVSCYLKLLIQAMMVALFVWILLAGSPDGRRETKTEASFAAESARKFGGGTSQVVVGTEKVVNAPKLDRVAYMSKRRVPNGPDPIHNRRAGKSGKPPGQA